MCTLSTPFGLRVYSTYTRNTNTHDRKYISSTQALVVVTLRVVVHPFAQHAGQWGSELASSGTRTEGVHNRDTSFMKRREEGGMMHDLRRFGLEQ